MDLRAPRAARVFLAVLAAGWCFVAGAGIAAAARARSPAIVIVLVLLLGGAHLLYRLFSVQVRGDGTRLSIRNTYSSRVLERDEIRSFRLGAASVQPFGLTIHVLTGDTVIPLDVAAQAWPSTGAKQHLQRQVEELEQWRRTG